MLGKYVLPHEDKLASARVLSCVDSQAQERFPSPQSGTQGGFHGCLSLPPIPVLAGIMWWLSQSHMHICIGQTFWKQWLQSCLHAHLRLGWLGSIEGLVCHLVWSMHPNGIWTWGDPIQYPPACSQKREERGGDRGATRGIFICFSLRGMIEKSKGNSPPVGFCHCFAFPF